MTPKDSSAAHTSSPEPRSGWRRVLEYWRPFVWALLCVELPLVVLNRFELPFGISFGYRSFSRNIAIVMVLGVLLGARGMPRPRSSLTAPMLLFFVAAWTSVALNGGRWADVRTFGIMVGLFIGARSISSSAGGRRWLFHWLGMLVVFTVVVEIYRNPAILQFREALRNTMVTAHPNTLGGFFALLAPIFIGTLDDKGARRMAPLYLACAFLGAALTFSRLSLAGLFFGSATVLLASWVRRHPVRVGVGGMVAAVIAVGVILYLSTGRAEADWQRLHIIHTSLTLFAENWLFGVGYGVENLEAVFPARYAEIYGKRLWLYHSHNMYVDVLVATGVVGAVCGAWLLRRLIGVGFLAIRASQSDPRIRRVGSGFAAIVLVFLVQGVGDMPLYHERLMFPVVISWGLMDAWATWAHTRPT